ncbi:MAG: hypothetical protein L6R38_004960 [Xanthoria sp. 2 TBL-2021]|nr:MAG: hypothetical protein L6R38_004960 [Xanthoria sp. 2 TBL-2021]
MASPKPIHTIVLDAGPMLQNDPSISSLLAKADRLVTVPAVLPEIRDATARSRIETTWMPFLETIAPSPQSLKAVTDFARRTGDLAVLSKPDLQILALTYEVESRRSGLSNIRTFPRQKLERPKPPGSQQDGLDASLLTVDGDKVLEQDPPTDVLQTEPPSHNARGTDGEKHAVVTDELAEVTQSLQIFDAPLDQTDPPPNNEAANVRDIHPPSEDLDSDSEGWITPANIQKHQAKDQNAAIPVSVEKPLNVACITSDFAMQNVLLSMNLGLLNTSLQRVRNIKTFVLRCHACFCTTKEMSKQFCPRCGKPTLTRVSCSTNSKGEFKLHLKKNMQWNHRGDRYSIPKPVPGSANGKVSQGKGGGKGGWGQSLILAEDQKEYLRATSGNGRKKETDLMDVDYLPSILTGERGRAGGKPRVGAGRNVNSKKR